MNRVEPMKSESEDNARSSYIPSFAGQPKDKEAT